MPTPSTYLDGNSVAGPLGALLGFDITTSVGICAGCHTRAVMARGRVYSTGPGLVLRCADCDHVLVRLVVASNQAWLDMSGLASLQIEHRG